MKNYSGHWREGMVGQDLLDGGYMGLQSQPKYESCTGEVKVCLQGLLGMQCVFSWATMNVHPRAGREKKVSVGISFCDGR